MRSRYACPQCNFDLKANPPKPTRHPWYKLISRYTRQCPACGAELKRRFADFDMGLATILSSGGAVSIWGAGRIVLPAIAILFAIRWVGGRIFSVYVLTKPKT